MHRIIARFRNEFSTRKNTVAEVWGGLPIDRTGMGYKSSSTIRKHINRKLSGSDDIDFLNYIEQRYQVKPFQIIASLGSNQGNEERELIKRNLTKEIDAYDISKKAIEKGEYLCQKEGIVGLTFIEQDLNKPNLPESKYDAIFAFKILHHIENLEGLFSKVQKSLKKGGYFFIDDYFGPTRLQWSDNQIKIINDLLKILPEELRKNVRNPDKIKSSIKRVKAKSLAKSDPSEAVRSGELYEVLANYFDIMEEVDYGGNIFLELFQDIMGNFNDNDPLNRCTIDLILYIEDMALKAGLFESSIFKYIVAKPKEADSINKNTTVSRLINGKKIENYDKMD